MNRDELHEQIEACRGPADLELPEFRRLAEQLERDPAARQQLANSHRIDASIRSAMKDVPVPAGLEDRVWAAVLAAATPAPNLTAIPGDAIPGDAIPGDAIPGDVIPGEVVPGEVSRAHSSAAVVERRSVRGDAEEADVPRRTSVRLGSSRWKWWAGLPAAAATLIFAWFVLAPRFEPRLATESDVVQAGSGWIQRVEESRWQRDNFPTSEFPLPRQLRVLPARWQMVSRPGERPRVVCYDLVSHGAQARLFVALTRQSPPLRSTPPLDSYQRSGAWTVAVWKDKSPVYVLSYQGGLRQYRQLISAGQFIAMWAACELPSRGPAACPLAGLRPDLSRSAGEVAGGERGSHRPRRAGEVGRDSVREGEHAVPAVHPSSPGISCLIGRLDLPRNAV